MRYKHYQNANVDVSELAVGTWAIGGMNYGDVVRADSVAAIRKMLACGVNLIDTAPVYGNCASEMVVGEAIQGIPRDSFMISTKFGISTDYHATKVRDTSYKAVMREIQSSLFNLRTDYVDFYFIHYPDVNTPIAETMTALNELKRDGVIRYIGVSNFSREQIEEAQKYGVIDVQQPPYSMVNRSATELMQWGYAQGIDAMTYGSLGAGILSGAVRSMPDFAPNDLRLHFYDFYREPKFSKIMAFLKVLDGIAEAHNVPVSQVAINWNTQTSFVGTSLIGVRNAKEAEENCAAFDWKLSEEEIALINKELINHGI